METKYKFGLGLAFAATASLSGVTGYFAGAKGKIRDNRDQILSERANVEYGLLNDVFDLREDFIDSCREGNKEELLNIVKERKAVLEGVINNVRWTCDSNGTPRTTTQVGNCRLNVKTSVWNCQ